MVRWHSRAHNRDFFRYGGAVPSASVAMRIRLPRPFLLGCLSRSAARRLSHATEHRVVCIYPRGLHRSLDHGHRRNLDAWLGHLPPRLP